MTGFTKPLREICTAGASTLRDEFIPRPPRRGNLVGHVECRAVQVGRVRVDLRLDAVHPEALAAFLARNSELKERTSMKQIPSSDDQHQAMEKRTSEPLLYN